MGRSTLAPLPLLLYMAQCEGNVYQYHDEPLQPNVVQYRRVGMWEPRHNHQQPPTGTAAELRQAEPDGSSSISIDLSFKRSDARRAGVVQAAVFHSAQLADVGTPTEASGRHTFCCTSALKAQGVPGCDRVGHLIVRRPAAASEAGYHMWSRDISFGANESVGELKGKVAIKHSGVHYMLLASCELHTGAVSFSGQTSWLNPHGYLPGELYSFLPFFGAMALAYLGLGFVWAVQCARHWAQLLPLQACIAAVILLGELESFTWYCDYVSFNQGGTRGVVPVVVGVTMSTVRKTVSRLLVLSVCLGYGVVRPTLGTVAYRVLALGCAYTIFSAALDVVSNVSQMSEMSGPARVAFIAPVFGLDVLFYWWTFSGLTRTLTQLSTRRQSAKLTLYRRFSYVLVASIGLSGLWVAWQMGVLLFGSLDSRWATLWVFDAFWHVLYFVLLVAICLLWAPSGNNLQYAYMDELGQAEDEEEEEPEQQE